jgi:hypothetical protein
VGSNGSYEINLPSGSYDIYATARGCTQGSTRKISVSNGSKTRIDFNDVKPSGHLNIQVLNKETRKPLDARISIHSGYQPLIRYFGKNTFFTELDTQGETTVSIAPGHYVFEISAGGGFTSTQQLLEVDVISHELQKLKIDIPVTITPHEQGWYSADLHHHSDVLDGFTEASYVMRSELAAGVDITFLSDHDSVVNNQEMRVLSETRGMHFIPATELSPSWGHFNAYPLDDGKTVDIDIGQATVQEVFATARRMGADIVEVNHPYSDYGYFHSLTQPAVRGKETSGAVPGAYDAGFDLVEITPQDNTRTLQHIWNMWNEGHRVYLAAGSDVHDVWRERSGSARTYVHVDGDLNIDKFIAALKAGHAFASQGPVIYPDILFGSEVHHIAGARLALAYAIDAASGLRSVRLIERGDEIDVLTINSPGKPAQVNFTVSPEANTWYSLVVEDMKGKFAYTNPVWVLIGK